MKYLLVLFACTGSVSFSTGSAWAYGLGTGKHEQLTRIAARASTYLAQVQLHDGRWAWRVGEGKATDNYNGLVAEALLAAHEQTGMESYLRSAQRFADYLLHKFARDPDVLPFKPDIEFLVRLTEVTGDELYADVAAHWFGAVLHISPRASMEVTRILQGRRQTLDLVGYDVALGVRAALAVGEIEYARDLLQGVWQVRSEWLKQPTQTFGTISRAALLNAATMMSGFDDLKATLRTSLMSQQGANGSWCSNETQATAYAVRALALQRDPAAQRAAMKGSFWLSESVLKRGAWAHFNDGVPEPFVGDVISAVNAEALTAVILANRH